MEWTLTRQRNNEWREYRLFQDGEEVAFAQWRPWGESAELHNSAAKSTKSVLLKTREVLEQDFKKDMREEGVKYLTVLDLTANVDKVRKHYWRFMGFEFMRDIVNEYGAFTFATMEV